MINIYKGHKHQNKTCYDLTWGPKFIDDIVIGLRKGSLITQIEFISYSNCTVTGYIILNSDKMIFGQQFLTFYLNLINALQTQLIAIQGHREDENWQNGDVFFFSSILFFLLSLPCT